MIISKQRRVAASLLVGALVLASFGAVQAGLQSSAQENPYPNCRFGMGSVGGSTSAFATDQLGIGWHVDWNAHVTPPRPNGIQHLQTIRLRQNKSGSTYLPGYVMTPTLTMAANGLGPRVQANPGAIWVVGNEPDRVDVQDDTHPQIFAQAYHDAHAFIKGIDPTARVAMPGLVEITPLRLEYLNVVSSTYRSLYTTTLPVDVWTAHIYILPEGQGYGARYPVGITPTLQIPAKNYLIKEHDSLTIFAGQVQAMRAWMHQNGYRDKPLLFTEFGILYPSDILDEDGQDFDAVRVNTFMNGVFDYFRSAADPVTGHPADFTRLVQAWAWYSMADTNLNGTLFDPVTNRLTAIGENFAAYTRSLGPDLLIPVSAALPVYSPGGPVTATITAHTYNRGNAAFTGPYTVTFYSDISHTQVISQVMLSNLASQVTRTVQVSWPAVGPGLRSFYPTITVGGTESNACNNWGQGHLLVAQYQIFLPAIQKLK